MAFMLCISVSVLAMNGRTTYQAKIIKPDGYPLESTSVNFRFTVLDTVGSCVLYIENYAAINMSQSGGLVSFALGNGARSFPASGTSQTFQNTFDNSITSFSCQSPGIYNPDANDTRKIVMQFNDGNGWQTLPAMTVNAVPYAMYAVKANETKTLNGKADTDFVEKTTLASLNCNASTHAITFNGVSFSCIPVGSGGGGGITSVTTSGSVLSTAGTASAPVISIQAATMSQDGYLTALDYAEFKAKLSASSTQLVNTLGYVPASAAAVTGLQSSLGTLAYGNSIDLGSASATGIISDARLANQADVVSGTQYTKVKVDGRGRVVSGAQLAASDVTTALGYTPASASASTQWNTSGTTINYLAGKVGIGTSSPQSNLDVSGSINASSIFVAGAGTGSLSLERLDAANTQGTVLRLKRSRGTLGSSTPLQSSDYLGELSFEGRSSTGYAGSSIDAEARIYARLDSGTVGFDNTNMPTSIYFSNKTDGDAFNTTKMIINSSGNVGIGTIAPGANTKLSIEGQIRSKSFSTASNAIDWANGNSGTTSHDCGSTLTLANIRDGGSYTLSVTGTGTAQCSFSTTTTGDDAATVTYRFYPTNAVRTASSHTIYSFQRIGTVIYVSWITGF